MSETCPKCGSRELSPDSLVSAWSCGTTQADGYAVHESTTCLRAQLAAEKGLRHDAMTAYAKLEADWRAEKALREAAEKRTAELVAALVELDDLLFSAYYYSQAIATMSRSLATS